MSAFNILRAKIKCPNCNVEYTGYLQFKFGDTWLLEYNIGDKIKWGGNDIGRPGLAEVRVYGILEDNTCPNCRKNNPQEEYDIIVLKDVIDHINIIHDINDYLTDDANFKIIM